MFKIKKPYRLAVYHLRGIGASLHSYPVRPVVSHSSNCSSNCRSILLLIEAFVEEQLLNVCWALGGDERNGRQ